MATYDSIHTGEQVDEAVDIVLNNKNKGSNVQPIYLDANGEAKNVNVDATPTQDSQNLVQSGGVFTQLSTKYAKADISTDDELGTSNVLIPSQGAVKSYVDTHLAEKQDVVVAGDGIVKDGNTLSISTDNDFMTAGKLDNKWSHFVSGLDMGYGTETIEKMENAKRSSFDLSKFTVVGSPNITDDGVVHFPENSNNDYLKLPEQFKPWDKPWEIYIEGKIGGSWNTAPTLFTSTGSVSNYGGVSFGIVTGHDKFRLSLNLDNTQTGFTDFVDVLGIVPIFNTEYWFKLAFTGTAYQVWISNDKGKTYTLNNSLTSSVPFAQNQTAPSCIGTGRAASSAQKWYGTIDLKQFSITVDGGPYFSGNKTGIDTIKPDEYTSVPSTGATFTLTEDGILSNTDNSNYLAANKLITYNSATNNLKIKFKCKTPSSDIALEEGNVRAIYWSQSQNRLTFNKNGYMVLEIGGSNYLPSQGAPNTKYYNENVDVEIICEGRKQTLKVTLSNGTVLTSSLTANADFGFDSSAYIRLGQGILSTWMLMYGANLDLNSFRVYVDDELVYQPCLKVPYTLTKDGKKIVDSIYRDRVEDEYTQAGFTPYYTLNTESRGNYTVVGSPTISSDWIASGFSSSNYLKLPALSTTSNSVVEIRGEINTANLPSDAIQDIISSSTAAWFRLVINANRFSLSAGGNDQGFSNAFIEQNKIYFIKILIDNTANKLYIYTSLDKENWTLRMERNVSVIFTNEVLGIGLNIYYFNRPFSYGSIDLKQLSITVDNKLVYQAVIPPNYTMATVKESTIVDSYDNEMNKWTKLANLTCKQQGSCTSGTAVTFTKPYIDTNYALSAPYSAKTKTGFTPSATGDWIANGKVDLNA